MERSRAKPLARACWAATVFAGAVFLATGLRAAAGAAMVTSTVNPAADTYRVPEARAGKKEEKTRRMGGE